MKKNYLFAVCISTLTELKKDKIISSDIRNNYTVCPNNFGLHEAFRCAEGI